MGKGKFPIERFKDIETPFYWYDADLLRNTLESIMQRPANTRALWFTMP